MDKFYKANLKIVSAQNKEVLPKPKQFKYLSFLLDLREKTILKILIILLIISSIFFIYKGFTLLNEIPVNGGIYTEGVIGRIQYLNPVLESSNNIDIDIDSLIYPKLFRFNNRTLQNELVDSYTISDDKKTYDIKIKNNIYWDDGENLTADDIIFTLNLIENPSFRSPLYPDFKNVKIEKINDYDFKLEIEKPYSSLISNLTFGILPKHIWEDINYIEFPLSEFNLKPIGAGPYKFKSISKSKEGLIRSYTLQRNDNYFGKKPYIDEITFKFVNDEDELMANLQEKKIDGANYISYNNTLSLKNKPYNFYHLYLPQYQALFINQNLNPLLKEKYIREAIYYGINKDEIIEKVYNGNAQKVESPFLEGMPGFDPNFKNYQFNPQKAVELLETNGWKRNPETQMMEKDGKQLSISITAVANPDNEKYLSILQKQLNDLGINVDTELIDGKLIKDDIIKPRNYDLLLYGELLGNDSDIYAFWHSSQADNPGLNLAQYKNSDVDKAIEQARETLDPEEKQKLYSTIAQKIKDDVPAIFLINPSYTYTLSDKIKGFKSQNLISPSDRFENISDWYIKTRKKIF